MRIWCNGTGHIDPCGKGVLYLQQLGEGIGLDKGGYPVNIFIISAQKIILCILIRSASARRF